MKLAIEALALAIGTIALIVAVFVAVSYLVDKYFSIEED